MVDYNSILGTRRMFQYQCIIEDGIVDLTALDFRANPCHCSVNRITCSDDMNCTNQQAQLYDLHWTRKNLG